MMIQAHLPLRFFTTFFMKGASLKRFYLYMKLLQSNSIFKQATQQQQKDNSEVSWY